MRCQPPPHPPEDATRWEAKHASDGETVAQRERERVRDVLPDGWPKGGGGHAPLDRDPLVRGKRKGG
jgi:hypothetical protein